jgi:hypothetical protein
MINNAPAPATDDAPAPITLQDFLKAKEALHNQIADLLSDFCLNYGQLVREYTTLIVEDDDDFRYEGSFTFQGLFDASPESPAEQ